jgi:hypothetical protein
MKVITVGLIHKSAGENKQLCMEQNEDEIITEIFVINVNIPLQ